VAIKESGWSGEREQTFNISQTQSLTPQHPLPPIPQNRLLEELKGTPHLNQRLRTHEFYILLCPAAAREVLAVLLELVVCEQRRVRRDELRGADEDACVDGPVLEQLLGGFLGG